MGTSSSTNLELESGRVVNGYQVERILGIGTFGDVYKVQKNGKHFALKRIDKSKQQLDSVKNEIQSLQIGAHVNVVGYIDRFHDSVSYNIILEYCEYGSIDEYLRRCWNCTFEKKRMGFIQNIADGVAYLHENNIAHRDLKPDNILIDSQGVAKIADFGLAKVFDSPDIRQTLYTNTLAGTYPYMAPEVINGESYTMQADIFSMGLIFCCILHDDNKKYVEEERIGFKMINNQNYYVQLHLLKGMRNNMVKLILNMLQKKYKDRVMANYISGRIKLFREYLD
ncbi:aurora kinase B-like [Anneissia japonica]|uniref:aurora kinase B-like n=1 Tax=Anneissia japonica TaxID=1529436 RepID=UPI001425750F|nr:aurora kinase B-like [Anneissia japonica]XP_033117747.1 aurora kinase B-like [Anneissia japonica]